MRQRDIILIPFPFSDQINRKVRPGIVVSNDKFNKNSDDVIVCAINSNVKMSDYTVIINQEDLESGFLYERSAVKVENIFKIEKSLIIKSIGTLSNEAFPKINKILIKLFNPVD